MLIDFELENFRSYRGAMKFSFVASKIAQHPANLVGTSGLSINLLKTAAVYGPNGSGKSNLLLAMQTLGYMMVSPMMRHGLLPISPFTLDTMSKTKPTRFSIRFIVQDIMYAYSISARADQVEEERLVAVPGQRGQEWFVREGQNLKFPSSALKGRKKALKDVMLPHIPFLAVALAFGQEQLSIPARWLASNLGSMWSLNDFPSPQSVFSEAETTRLSHENKQFHTWTDAFMKHADIGIQRLDIKVVEKKVRRRNPAFQIGHPESVQETVEERPQPFFVHKGESGIMVEFELDRESQGTRRLFGMLAPLYRALVSGQVAIMDELSASLHPSLVRELIRLFHEPETNPNNAQLLFATHDTSLLNGRIFRRDQIWFTEKSDVGATDLYSLHDIEHVRVDEEAYEDGYLRGRYGALPFFNKFDFPPVPEGSVRPKPARKAVGRQGHVEP